MGSAEQRKRPDLSLFEPEGRPLARASPPLGGRQRELERGAPAGSLAAARDRAAMPGHDPLADVETQPRAFLPRLLVGLAEGFEERASLFGREPKAGIGNAGGHPALAGQALDPDPPAPRPELAGVREKGGQD